MLRRDSSGTFSQQQPIGCLTLVTKISNTGNIVIATFLSASAAIKRLCYGHAYRFLHQQSERKKLNLESAVIKDISDPGELLFG
jgi:hypothetical protein